MSEVRIAADRLIDGTGAPARIGFEVIVRDGLMAAVEPTREYSGAVRYAGATVLPGLVDAHVHLSLPGDARPYEAMALESDAQMVSHGLRNAALHLAAGVTTVRDNGARNRVGFAIRDLIAAGAPGPRVLASGPDAELADDDRHRTMALTALGGRLVDEPDGALLDLRWIPTL